MQGSNKIYSYLSVVLLCTLLTLAKARAKYWKENPASLVSSVRHLAVGQLNTTFTLQAQFSYGTVEDCPQIFKLHVPNKHDPAQWRVSIPYHAIKIGSGYSQEEDFEHLDKVSCQNAINSEPFTLYEGSRLDIESFRKKSGNDVSVSTLFESLIPRFSTGSYWLTEGMVSPFSCASSQPKKPTKWFSAGFSFCFFYEMEAVPIRVVRRVTPSGISEIADLRLPENVRYMITTASRTTCIYRAKKSVGTKSVGTPQGTPFASKAPSPSWSSAHTHVSTSPPSKTTPHLTPGVQPITAPSTSSAESRGADASFSVLATPSAYTSPSSSSSPEPSTYVTPIAGKATASLVTSISPVTATAFASSAPTSQLGSEIPSPSTQTPPLEGQSPLITATSSSLPTVAPLPLPSTAVLPSPSISGTSSHSHLPTSTASPVVSPSASRNSSVR